MDEKIEKATKRLIEMYEEIENGLLEIIASHFQVDEEFYNSDFWRIKKLEEMGVFNQEVIKYIAKRTNKTNAEIKKALDQIGIDTININKLEGAFKDGKLKIDPSILVNNSTIQAIINTTYNELTNEFINLSQKIEIETRRAYLSVVEEAYLKTSMGTHSYQEAIREAINNLSNQGIKTLVYRTTDETGTVTGIRSYDIESAVRREVLTNARTLSNKIAEQTVEELECEYVYLSEHLECRPTHFNWQGTVIKYKDLVKVTRYGEVDGLSGINCRHYFEPYYGDARGDELKKFNKDECEKAYNNTQKQRYLERGIRKWKRKANMYRTNGDTEAYEKSADKVNEWYSRLDNFTKENDLKRDFEREYVSGYIGSRNSSKPSKAVVETLNNLGISADNSLGKIDSQLLKDNVAQIKMLSEKYDMENFYYDMQPTYYCKNQKAVASISFSKDMTRLNINSSYEFFASEDKMINLMKELSEDNWCMPYDESKTNVYVMTHEFGHMLEMKLYKDIYPFGNSIGYIKFANSVKDDIIDIARAINADFDYIKEISGYGDTKPTDFFAEVFANMELGKPNELGNAMKIYLKNKGVIK